MKNIKNFLSKFSIFTAEKILCILHGQVFVMMSSTFLSKRFDHENISPLQLIQEEHLSTSVVRNVH